MYFHSGALTRSCQSSMSSSPDSAAARNKPPLLFTTLSHVLVVASDAPAAGSPAPSNIASLVPRVPWRKVTLPAHASCDDGPVARFEPGSSLPRFKVTAPEAKEGSFPGIAPLCRRLTVTAASAT